MRQAAILLTMVAVVIASPVLIPIALMLNARDQRRMQAAAGKARCENCGAILGTASLHRANTDWAAHVAKLLHDRPGIKLRLARHLFAVCVTCGAEYDFDAVLRVFPRLR